MSTLDRVHSFTQRYGLAMPILQAPMAGACPVALAAAVANAGGMGGMGALLTKPEGIEAWARDFRGQSNGGFQLNLWIPDPPPQRDAAAEAKTRDFLGQWGPTVEPNAGDATPPDFAAQCEALIAAGPRAVSSIMGLFPAPYTEKLKARGIAWFATVTT
jgi:nitronate monooxygenase